MKPVCGPARVRTARASIGLETSTPNASPSGPAARASEAVMLPGPHPTSSTTPPWGIASHSIGCRYATSSLRDNAWALLYNNDPSGEAHAA